MAERQRQGHDIERQVASCLEESGYAIREFNWHCRYGELDIVTLDGENLVFVEVRSRRPSAFGSALESVTDVKLERVMAAAEMYVQEHPEVGDLIWRVDIVAVTLSNDGSIANYQHLENVTLD